ncbi:hypothetical protein GCM10011376_00210 [Nocardioides flavus (ex Wang et al. 2016)]|uniref:Uncharacterized protein n=1 Tax=Nocardioides flavus (ex Wang et al. 2016) TaxID=2058780 RepID=A0ABQ3HDT4_9ACTN|nr:hypothetical protein [Nocardioides flavus (ex Wang et al. 2016)]GHE14838.1 hypothetical protein GCM10011376_00210 [Nocardioides flavus (ex Wang et al. 2016)]
MTAIDKILSSAFVDTYSAALAPSFDFLDTSAGAEVEVPGAPAAVSAAIQKLLTDQGHTVIGASEDQLELAVVTRKTMLSWELATGIEIAPTPHGSHVSVFVQNMPGRPKALLDGKKNKKAAQKLAEQIRTAV